MRPLLTALALAGTLFLAGCGEEARAPDPVCIPPTMPSSEPIVLGPSRRGLRFCYFGGSADEILSSVTTSFVTTWGWNNVSLVVNRTVAAKAAGCDVILAIDELLWDKGRTWTYVGTSRARANLHATFAALQEAGALDAVAFLYPCDEPERDANISEADLRAMAADLRAMTDLFPELMAVKLMCIFGDAEDYRCSDLWDVLGFDAYDMGSTVLGAKLDRLLAQLLPHQQVAIVPGGADPWAEPIGPWYAAAQASPRIAMICAFMWREHKDGAIIRPGIATNDRKLEYVAAGTTIRNA